MSVNRERAEVTIRKAHGYCGGNSNNFDAAIIHRMADTLDALVYAVLYVGDSLSRPTLSEQCTMQSGHERTVNGVPVPPGCMDSTCACACHERNRS